MMTSYYPHNGRKSLLENCLFNAFHSEYEKQIKTLRDEAAAGQKKNTAMPTFKSFSLKQSNQNYTFTYSDKIDSLTYLFSNMADRVNDPRKLMLSRESLSNGYDYVNNGIRFDTSKFEVSQIDDLTYKDVITTLHSLYTNTDRMLYGALIYDGNKFFNPLHPLNAQAFFKNATTESINYSRKYRLMIYTYRSSFEKQTKQLIDDRFNDLFLNQILGTLSLLDEQNDSYEKITSITNLDSMYGSGLKDQAYHFSKVQYTYETVSVDGKSYTECYLQPVQLINDGIVAPYYGIVLEKKREGSSNTSGYNLSPMFSCNIGLHHFQWLSKNNEKEVSISAANVCTGNYSNTSLDGKLSLNHANLGSPFYNEVLFNGSFQFAELCIKVSLGIYADLFDLTPVKFLPDPETQAPISFEEYKRLNPGAGLKEYITGIKNIKG